MSPAAATPFTPAAASATVTAGPPQPVSPVFGGGFGTLLAAVPSGPGASPVPQAPDVLAIVTLGDMPVAPQLPIEPLSSSATPEFPAIPPPALAAPPVRTSSPPAPPASLASSADTAGTVPATEPFQVADPVPAQAAPIVLAVIADAGTREPDMPDAVEPAFEAEAEPVILAMAPPQPLLVPDPPRAAVPLPTAGPTLGEQAGIGATPAAATSGRSDPPSLLAETHAVAPEAAAAADPTPAFRADANTPDLAATPDFTPTFATDAVPAAPAAREVERLAPPTPPAEPIVAARPGQAGRELGLEIARVGREGGDELIVRLDPAELGRVEVRLAWDEGVLQATVRAEHPAALELFRRELADLGRALGEAGVRADTAAFRFEGGGGGGRHARSDHPGDGPTAAAREAPHSPSNPTAPEVRLAQGRIDLIA